MQNQWNQLAQQWQHLETPIRPHKQDIDIIRNTIQHYAEEKIHVLLLGVTPEIAQIPWPQGTILHSLEKSSQMIAHVWPKNIENANVICQNWLDYTVEQQYDFVLGDGVLNLMQFPNEYQVLFKRIHTWLKPKGSTILRYFQQHPHTNTPQQVIEDASEQQIEQFHIFKLRLCMALQREYNIPVKKVFEYWQNEIETVTKESFRKIWGTEKIQTIYCYQNSDSILSFPPLDKVLAIAQNYFALHKTCVPQYSLGEYFPTLCLAKR